MHRGALQQAVNFKGLLAAARLSLYNARGRTMRDPQPGEHQQESITNG